jgi:hypothetical protein
MNRFFLITLVVFATTGTASAALPESSPNPKTQEVLTCLHGIDDSPELAPLKSKMNLVLIKDSTMQMLASTERASASDKPLILKWSDARENCVSMMIKNASPNDPNRSLMETDNVLIRQITARLYNGSLTYGEFNNRRLDLYNEAQKELAARKSAQQQSAPPQQATQPVVVESAPSRPASQISQEQALAICRPRAELAGSRARDQETANQQTAKAQQATSIHCDSYLSGNSGSTDCRQTPSTSGGFMFGAAAGFEAANRQEAAYENTSAVTMQGCMAEYGYIR